MAKLERVGINLDAIAEELSVEGIAAFDKSMTELLHTLDEKRKKLRASNVDRQQLNLGAAQSAVEQRLTAWEKDNFNRRLWAKDYKLWSATPVPELTDRMGWLTLPDSMQQHVKDLESFSKEIKDAGYRYIVLLGMGGSSLAPEVYQRTFGNAPGYPRQTGQTCVFGGAPNVVEHAQKIFDCVSRRAWTSRPMTASQSDTEP